METVNIDQWDEELSLVGSEHRAGQLLAIVRDEEPEVARELLRHWFPICDALRPWAAELREQFRRVGWVSDDPEFKQPFRELTVYRGAWHDDAEETALSWTLDRRVAENFCRIMSGGRGWFLGIRRDDALACVFQATCVEPLAYFNRREEREIIVGRLKGRERISALMTPEQMQEYQETGRLPHGA